MLHTPLGDIEICIDVDLGPDGAKPCIACWIVGHKPGAEDSVESGEWLDE